MIEVGQIVRVPEGEVLSAELQNFSRSRTGFLLAGAVGATAFVVFKILDTGFGDSGDGDPGPDVLFSFLKIPIG